MRDLLAIAIVFTGAALFFVLLIVPTATLLAIGRAILGS